MTNTTKLFEIRRVVPTCESSTGYSVYDTMHTEQDARLSLRQLFALGHWGWIVRPDGSDLTPRPARPRTWKPSV